MQVSKSASSLNVGSSSTKKDKDGAKGGKEAVSSSLALNASTKGKSLKSTSNSAKVEAQGPTGIYYYYYDDHRWWFTQLLFQS